MCVVWHIYGHLSTSSGDWNSSVVVCWACYPARCSIMGSTHLEPSVEWISCLELAWVLTPFPKTCLDVSINRGLVCAHLHSIAWAKKNDLDIHVLYGWMPATKTHPACTIHEDIITIGLPLWFDLKKKKRSKKVTYIKILTHNGEPQGYSGERRSMSSVM